MPAKSQVKVTRFTSSVFYPITNATNNGSGLIRLTITNAGTIAYATGDRIFVYNVGGTTEANGFWTVTVINNTTIDLQGSTFTNTYTSGGRVQTAGTFSKQSWAQWIRLVLIGGGGGGGGGSSTTGGGGGGGAGVLDVTLSASQLHTSENYSVATGGNNGVGRRASPAVTVTSGTRGGDTAFTIGNNSTRLTAYGGGGGFSGQGSAVQIGGGGGAGLSGAGGDGQASAGGAAGLNNGAGGGGPGGTLNSTSIQGGGAGGGGGLGVGAGPATPGGVAPFGAGGGGWGGWRANPAAVTGGVGGASRDILGGAGGLVNGAGTTINGTKGTDSLSAAPGSGGGGGGGGDSIDGGLGGAGGIPGGGGGGGGPGPNNGGDGAVGARGEIWVIEYAEDPVNTIGYGYSF